MSKEEEELEEVFADLLQEIVARAKAHDASVVMGLSKGDDTTIVVGGNGKDCKALAFTLMVDVMQQAVKQKIHKEF